LPLVQTGEHVIHLTGKKAHHRTIWYIRGTAAPSARSATDFCHPQTLLDHGSIHFIQKEALTYSGWAYQRQMDELPQCLCRWARVAQQGGPLDLQQKRFERNNGRISSASSEPQNCSNPASLQDRKPPADISDP
jgi:hypothetical protein